MSESCREKPQSKPGFIVMLFDYTQVKWKVYLHPLKITFSLGKLACAGFCNWPKNKDCGWMRIVLPLDINSDRLIFYSFFFFHLSFRSRPSRATRFKIESVCLACIPVHLPCTNMRCCLFWGCFFFDDMQWQSFSELHRSCLSSGCSVWCAFEIAQAHRWSCLTVGPWHQTQKQLKSEGEEGRKHALRQSAQTQRQKPAFTQAVLIDCDIVQGFC